MSNWYDKPLTSKQKDAEIERLQQENISLLHLLALIREACGDNGKRMQDELVTFIRDQRQGHLSHIALLKASLKQAGQETDAALERVKALEAFISNVASGAYGSRDRCRIGAALLEKQNG